METILNNISTPGIVILGVQSSVFLSIVFFGVYQVQATKLLRRLLSQSLRTSNDSIDSQSGMLALASDCRTRYRNAAESIESVDAEAIVTSEMARFPAFKFGFIRWSFVQIDDLIQGGPGFLITLGLIGTFFGLIQNLGGLSTLFEATDGISQQTDLLDGFSQIFPAMGAAFTTSLFGVLLSSIVWILGIFFGITRLRLELELLLCGYLEQVVQANCRCYSLVGESMERMEAYLTDYLSKFSLHVGRAIEESINASIGKLVLELSDQINETKNFVLAVTDGSQKLEASGKLFFSAAKVLEKSAFASEFADACEHFLEHTRLLGQSAGYLNDSSNAIGQKISELSEYLDKGSILQEKIVDASDVSIKALQDCVSKVDLICDKNTAILKESSTSLESSMERIWNLSSLEMDQMKVSVEAMQGLQKRGMTWLSMRAKTDSKLVEINSTLQDLLAQFVIAVERVNQSTGRSFDEYRAQINSLSGLVESISNEAKGRESDVLEVKDGLNRMAEIEKKIEEMTRNL